MPWNSPLNQLDNISSTKKYKVGIKGQEYDPEDKPDILIENSKDSGVADEEARQILENHLNDPSRQLTTWELEREIESLKELGWKEYSAKEYRHVLELKKKLLEYQRKGLKGADKKKNKKQVESIQEYLDCYLSCIENTPKFKAAILMRGEWPESDDRTYIVFRKKEESE